MTGLMTPMKRSGFWTSKRVFFVTPQVLEKDIQSGSTYCYVFDHFNSGFYGAGDVSVSITPHIRVFAGYNINIFAVITIYPSFGHWYVAFFGAILLVFTIPSFRYMSYETNSLFGY